MSLLSQTDQIFFNQTGMDAGRVARQLDDVLRGADDGELYLGHAQTESFLWDDGRLKSATFDTEQGFGLRAVLGETVLFAHASDLQEDALRRAVGAIASAKAGYSGAVALPPSGKTKFLYENLNPLIGKSFEDKIKLLQDVDAFVRAKDSRVHQVSVSLAANWRAVQIIREGGFRVADIRPLVHFQVSVVMKSGEKIEQAVRGAGGRFSYDRYFDPAVWGEMAADAVRKAERKLEAVPARAGEMTVVLGPGWPAVLLHEAVGHGLEGDGVRKGESAFAGLLGQKVAADGVTIIDDGTLKDKRGSLSIDDEGVPSQRTVLIENGVLVGFMQDRLNARLMGVASTGSGRRESFSSQPYPRMTNTMMLGGSYAPEEIIASVKKGLYATNFGGGQVDTVSGNFVFSATEAYEIENGKIGRPVKGASLVGTGFEALKRISMIGNDFALDDGIGMCGKNGQSVPVGVGQPTLRLDNMTVGGSSMA